MCDLLSTDGNRQAVFDATRLLSPIPSYEWFASNSVDKV